VTGDPDSPAGFILRFPDGMLIDDLLKENITIIALSTSFDGLRIPIWEPTRKEMETAMLIGSQRFAEPGPLSP
jgi:hypothetical protein